MYSDEETSFIHMDTSMVAHFESDHQSPSLKRKLQDLAVSESATSSQICGTSSQSEVTSSDNSVVQSEDSVDKAQENEPCSSHTTGNVTSSNVHVKPSENQNSSPENDVTSSNGDVTSAENSASQSVQDTRSSSPHGESETDATSLGGSSIPSDQCNLKSASTDSMMRQLASDSTTSLSLSEIGSEPLDSACENSADNKINCDGKNISASSVTSKEESNFSENNEPINPIKAALKKSSITLEHNRVGSPNHFRTVIVSHDQAEDVRKSDKDGKISLTLGMRI